MTDQYTSPYTGRPINEWLDEEIELHDTNGDDIGNVVEINPDFIVAEAPGGFLGLGEPKLYYIPRNYVAREEGDDWYLSVDNDQIESFRWGEPPAESAWSTEWREQGEAYKPAGQGQTRLRRYEEDLDVQKVERDAGEVVVNKRVVEETKTIEVPVRREEVHIERRPVTDGYATSSDATTGEAFTEDSIRVPVMAEEVEVRKVVRPVEEIEITKSQTQDTRQVEDTVRREEFDVDDSTTNR